MSDSIQTPINDTKTHLAIFLSVKYNRGSPGAGWGLYYTIFQHCIHFIFDYLTFIVGSRRAACLIGASSQVFIWCWISLEEPMSLFDFANTLWYLINSCWKPTLWPSFNRPSEDLYKSVKCSGILILFKPVVFSLFDKQSVNLEPSSQF